MPITLNSTTTFQLGAGPTLNAVDGSGVVWRATAVSGWDNDPATSLTPVIKPRAPGAWAGDSYPGDRIISIGGTITAPTPALLNTSIDALKLAVSEAGFTLTGTNGSGPRWVTARRQGETIVSKVSNVYADFSISVVSMSARLFGTALVGTTCQPASSGGKVWPETWPEVWSATTISGTVTLTNPGTRAGPVVLRVDGPCTGPQISHQGATGSAIAFAASLVLTAGQWLTISMDTRTVLANDQSNRRQYVLANPTAGWSAFDPGVNTWSYSAAVYDPTSLLTVTVVPAW
jgi:hypothetical protein